MRIGKPMRARPMRARSEIQKNSDANASSGQRRNGEAQYHGDGYNNANHARNVAHVLVMALVTIFMVAHGIAV